MLDKMRKRKEELVELLKQTAIQLEQVRGALALCEELIREAEGNGIDVQAASVDQREDGSPVG